MTGYAVAICLFSVVQSGAVTIGFDPAVSSIAVGNDFDVNIIVSGLESTDVAAFDFTVNYDFSLLQFSGYSLGNSLGDLIAGEAVDLSWGDDGAGSINLAEVSLLGNLAFQEDLIVLATLSFVGLAEGESLLTISETLPLTFMLGDDPGNPLTAGTPGTSSVTVSPVPLPASVLLLFSGIAGAVLSRRKRATA